MLFQRKHLHCVFPLILKQQLVDPSVSVGSDIGDLGDSMWLHACRRSVISA